MMAAGVDAAGNIDFQLADLVGAGAFAEPFGDALRDRNGARRSKRAIVEAGAGDDVGHETRVGGGETQGREPVEQQRQIVERDMRQDQVLLMRDPDLVLRIGFGEIGDGLHLFGAGVAGNAANGLEGNRHDSIARRLMRRDDYGRRSGRRRDP